MIQYFVIEYVTKNMNFFEIMVFSFHSTFLLKLELLEIPINKASRIDGLSVEYDNKNESLDD